MSSPPGNIWLDLGKAKTVPSCRWGGLLLRSALEHRTLLLIRPLLSQGAGRNSDACKPNLATSTCSLRPLQRVWKKRAREREGKQETSENKQPQEFHIKELITFYPFSFLFHVNCQKREGGAPCSCSPGHTAIDTHQQLPHSCVACPSAPDKRQRFN